MAESRAAYFREYRKRKKREAAEAKIAGLASDPIGNAGELAAEWATANLKVPSGPLRGKPFQIDGWQREFLVAALGPGVREAGLSVARKNGKSGLIAALLLAYLKGPLNIPEFRALAVSLTGHLASELRDAITATAEASGLFLTVKRSPPPGEITGDNGARLTILASDKATGHAVGGDIAVVDEAGLLQETNRDLWNAIFSSVSGRDGRLLAISIKGDGPMFAEMAERSGADSVVWHEYAASEDADILDRDEWAKANPGLRTGIKSMAYMVDASARALASPADQPSFRAYDLNLPRNPSTETLCTPEDWRACEREELPERAGVCIVGFDLGGSSSLTALAAHWPETGRMEVWTACGDMPTLLERSRADGVGDLYLQMERRGELQTYGGRVTPAADFLRDCAGHLERERVKVAGADRYRRAEVEDALAAARIRWPMEWRGQGASASADGSHDVRAMQRLILSQRLAVEPSLSMRHAVRESVIRRDVSGNPALDKKRQKGRIDVMSAMVIAAGLGEREAARPERGKVELWEVISP